MKKVYTITQAAEELGISRAAVFVAIKNKRMKAKKGTFEIQRMVRSTVKGWCIAESDLNLFKKSR